MNVKFVDKKLKNILGQSWGILYVNTMFSGIKAR